MVSGIANTYRAREHAEDSQLIADGKASSVDDRRPIKARSIVLFHRLASRLVEKGVTPNQISVASVGFAGLGAAALLVTAVTSGQMHALLLIAAALFIQLRLICNLIDGMMAVEGGLRTKCGDMFNEFPDRIADSLLLIGAGYATQFTAVGWQLGWSAALFASITAYIRMFGAAKGLGHDFSGPMAKQQRMFVLTLACVLTPLESHLFHSNWSMLAALSIINIGTVVTCVRRTCKIARGLQNK